MNEAKKQIQMMTDYLNRRIREADEEWLALKDSDEIVRDYSQGIQHGIKIAYKNIIEYHIPSLLHAVEREEQWTK